MDSPCFLIIIMSVFLQSPVIEVNDQTDLSRKRPSIQLGLPVNSSTDARKPYAGPTDVDIHEWNQNVRDAVNQDINEVHLIITNPNPNPNPNPKRVV